MPDINDPQLFDSAIGHVAERWRSLEAKMARAVTLPDTHFPPEKADQLFMLAHTEAANYARYVEHEWGYDLLASPPRALPGAKMPRNAAEEQAFCGAVLSFLILRWAYWSIAADVPHTPIERRGTIAVRAMLEACQQFPSLLSDFITIFPFESVRLAATLGMSGWARTKLSLQKNKRLERAAQLEAGVFDQRWESALRQALPSAVTLAAHELNPEVFDHESFINRIAEEIADVLPEQGKRMTRKSVTHLSDATSRFAAEQEFIAREEAVNARTDLRDLETRAGLAQREQSIWELDSQGLTGGEIAERLGIAEGTVKGTLFRVRKKLDAAKQAG